MNVTAPENRQEQQQDTGINELKTVEAILKEPKNAEKLKNNFGNNLEKDLTNKDGLVKIQALSKSLNLIDQSSLTDQADKDGLNSLKTFLDKCLNNNEAVKDINKKLVNNLKKLDNGVRGVDIDESKIFMKNVSPDGDKLSFEYTLDGNNSIKLKTGNDGKISSIESGNINIAGKYYKIDLDEQNTDRPLKLSEDKDGFLNVLKTYKSNKNFDISSKDGGSLYNITFTLDEGDKKTDESSPHKISFELDADGKFDGFDDREKDGYKVSVDHQKKEFKIDKVESPTTQEETPTQLNESDDAVVAQQAASTSAKEKGSLEAGAAGDEKGAELTKESVIDKISPELQQWYTKEGSRNQLEGTISLLKIVNSDTPDIKTKKTELSELLNKGDIVAFQEALGLKKGFNADQADGKLGTFTLNKTKEILKSTTAQVDATSTNQISTETNTGTSTETSTGTSTETSTGTSTETNTGTSTETSTGTSTETNTGTSTETNTGTNTETNAGTNTETNAGTSTEATESDSNIYIDINSLRANLNPNLTNLFKVQDYLSKLNNLYKKNSNTQEKDIIKKEYIRTKFENVFTNNSSIRNGGEQKGSLNNGSYTAKYDKENDILTLTISNNEELVYKKKEFLGN